MIYMPLKYSEFDSNWLVQCLLCSNLVKVQKSMRWNWKSNYTRFFLKYGVNSNMIHQLIQQLIHHFKSFHDFENFWDVKLLDISLDISFVWRTVWGRIYNNVQLRLPSAFRDAGSDSEHSADGISGRHSEASEDGDLEAPRGWKWKDDD